MKKLASLLLLLIFLIANSHLAVSMHWCGGKITHIGVNSESESKCGCGAEMDAGCCKDLQVKVKLTNNDYQLNAAKIISAKIWKVIALPAFKFSGCINYYPLITKTYCSYHAPPGLNGELFLLNCNILV